MQNQSETLVTVETGKKLGITEAEFEQIVSIMGRTPNFTELSIYSVMWSEHCSYKNSIHWLKTLPREGKRLLVGAGEENAGLFPAELEAVQVRCEQVDEEHAADEVAARKDRHGETFDVPEHKKGTEIFLLHRPNAQVHLVKGGREDQHDRQCQQDDRHLQGGEELHERVPNVVHGLVGFEGLKKADEVGFFCGNKGFGTG